MSNAAAQNAPTQNAPTPAPNQPVAQQSSTQQSSSQQSPDKNSDKGKNEKDKTTEGTAGQGKVAGTSNDRLFYALPNFLSLESAKQLPPLTTGQKFKVEFLGSFDYIQIPWYGFLSSISQAENSEPGYGQGWVGYGKRFGSAFADGTIENFMVGAVLPSAVHQDPRFYELGHGSFWHRTGYAMSRTVVTLSDSGHKQFNYSEIVGSMLSAGISTYSYHPKSFFTTRDTNGVITYVFHPSDRTFVNTSKVWGTQVGYDTMTLVVKEFWPDIHRMILRKRHKPMGVEPAGTTP